LTDTVFVLIVVCCYFLPTVILTALATDVYMRNKSSATNRIFSALLLLFAYQYICQTLAYLLPPEAGILVYRWGTVPVSIATLFFSLLFYVKVTKVERNMPRWLLYAFGYVPFLSIFVLSTCTDTIISGWYIDEPWLRIAKGGLYPAYNVYMLLVTATGNILLYFGMKRSNEEREKQKFRKMLLLANISMVIGFLTAAEAGLISHFDLPAMPELGLIASLFWAWSFRMEMVKHNFFPYQLQIYEMLHRRSTFGIIIADRNGKIVEVNPAAKQVLDLLQTKVRLVTDLYPEPVREEKLEQYKIDFARRELKKDREMELAVSEGRTLLAAWDNGFLDFDDQQLQIYIARDITEQRANENKVAFLAYHDPLTGLANRAQMYDRIAQAIDRATEDHRFLFAVLLIDLDDFKRVNDSYGHYAGDRLLAHVAETIRNAVGSLGISARLGGDEFVVLLTGVASEGTARKIAERLVSDFENRPLQLPTQTIRISSSIGMSCFPRDGRDVDTLLQAADAAMYKAKGGGKNRMYTAANP